MPPRSEAGFMATVIALAKLRGWACAHFRPARTARGWRTPCQADGKGWPDLVLVRGPRILAVELKLDGARPTPAQALWLARLRAAGLYAAVWVPSMFPEIAEILA